MEDADCWGVTRRAAPRTRAPPPMRTIFIQFVDRSGQTRVLWSELKVADSMGLQPQRWLRPKLLSGLEISESGDLPSPARAGRPNREARWLAGLQGPGKPRFRATLSPGHHSTPASPCTPLPWRQSGPRHGRWHRDEWRGTPVPSEKRSGP